MNTSRGNMIVEADLAAALRHQTIGGAAVDVFGNEPYQGELCGLDNCLLTASDPHIVSPRAPREVRFVPRPRLE